MGFSQKLVSLFNQAVIFPMEHKMRNFEKCTLPFFQLQLQSMVTTAVKLKQNKNNQHKIVHTMLHTFQAF